MSERSAIPSSRSIMRVMGAPKIVAVAGTGSDSGKTTIVCRILRGIPGLAAVKISPRAGKPRVEWGPGAAGKDTARFAASGAVKVARIIAPRERVVEIWEEVKADFESLPGVVVEGASAVDLPGEKYVIFAIGQGDPRERFERNRRIAAISDCIVLNENHKYLHTSDFYVKLSHFISHDNIIENGDNDQDDRAIPTLTRDLIAFLRRRGRALRGRNAG